MRAKGLRQIQLWVPDPRSPGFTEECRRQSLLIAADPTQQTIMEELQAPGYRRLATVRRGDLVAVALPGHFGKQRSALVIQSDLFNETHSS